MRRGRNERAASAGGESDELVNFLQEIVPAHDPTASTAVRREELVHAFQVALAGLPSDHREALERLYIEGLPLDEAARKMDKTPAALRGLSHRAKAKFREAMVRLSLYI